MKRLYKYLALAMVSVFVIAGCIEILKFTHPDTAPINSEVNVALDVKVKIDKDNGDLNAPFVVSMLMPKAWDKSKISVTYTSANMPDGAVTNEPMRPTTDKDKYMSLNSNAGPGDWNTEALKILGSNGNYEPIQWVTFIGTKAHNLKALSEFTGTINIKLTTGSENIKVNLAYAICTDKDGFANAFSGDYGPYYELREKLFETTGADNPTIDYTIPKLCSVGPDSYTWEDIVSIKYDASIKVDDKDQPLKGKDKVYMIATATYDNGGTQTDIKIDEISTKTLMKAPISNKWAIYLYPHEYFNIPADKKIKQISCYFVDETGAIEIRPSDEFSEFTLVENCK